jgi:hypothetical protein
MLRLKRYFFSRFGGVMASEFPDDAERGRKAEGPMLSTHQMSQAAVPKTGTKKEGVDRPNYNPQFQ